MKKRLLSAALALAMVLTMLPLTVFAADLPETKSVTWYAKGTVFKDTATTSTPLTDGGWYVRKADPDNSGKYIYTNKTTGVLNSSATTSATWTESLANALTLKWATIRLLTNDSTAISTEQTNLTIDVDGHAFSGTIAMTKGGTLNIKDSSYKNDGSYTMKQGAGAITMGDSSATSSLTATVNLTNVSATSIDMSVNPGTHGVKLDNAKLTNGEVKMDGIGKYTNTSGNKVAVNAKQTFTALNDSACGALTVSGNNSTISVTNSTTGKVTLTGTSTTITVNGSESVVDETGGIELLASETDLKSGTAPKVTVNGGKVGPIGVGTGEKLENAKYTVEVNGTSNAETGAINLPNADIKVNGGTTDTIAVNTGSLSITNNATTGVVTWGGATSGSLSLTVSGDDTVVGGVTAANNNSATLSTVNITGGNFGSNFTLGSYAGNGVSGGSFKTPLLGQTGWLSKSVEYEVAEGAATYYYMGSDFQALVNKWATLINPSVKRINANVSSGKNGKITFVMEGAETPNTDVPLVTIEGNPKEAILAPSSVNNVGVSNWYEKGGSDKTYAAGSAIPFPDATKELKVYATLPGSDSSDIISVSAGNGISATLSGNLIKLSGYAPAGSAAAFPISLTITTANKKYDDAATITWWSNLKTFGLTVPDGTPFGAVGNTLAYNGKTYSFDISGLKLLSSDNVTIDNGSGSTHITGKDVAGNEIKGLKVAFNAGESASRPAFAEAVVGTGYVVDFSGSPAVLEALNREAGKITNLKTYTDAAKRAAAKAAGINNPTQTQLEAYGYNKVVIQPFLNVTVSAYTPGGSNSVGSMTANITPSYYIIVTGGGGDTPYVYNPNGTSLGTLSGDYGKVTVTLGLPSNFATSSGKIWIHHGDYVYEGTNTGGTTLTFITLHGFSPFVINGKEPAVEVDKVQGQDSTDTKHRYYDSLQTAVNDVADKGKITLFNNYTGTKSVTVVGLARSFTVDCGSNGNLALTFAGADVSTTRPTNNEYKVTLNASTAAGRTSIGVGTASNGTATVNMTSAPAGSTVTITVNPSNGYRSLAPTVRTNTGATVSVSGSGNTYTFVVPNGATSITVTPSFVQNTGLPFTDVAANAWYFDGVAYCYNNNLMQGYDGAATTFGINHAVTRAEVVTILWRLAGQPKETPRTTYTDVKSGEWHYDAIAWATNHGYAKGYGDGRFGPNNPVQRQELAVFLHRYAGSPAVSANLGAYSDGQGVADWALAAMRWATSYSILSGTNSVSLNGRLNAYSTAYREQVAVTLQHYHQYYK